jgi:hypothetical protein
MLDRDVVGLLLEVLDRVPPVAQHLGDQCVSLADGRGGVVDEPALGRPPRLQVARSGVGLEFDNVELVVALLALCELGFRGASIARSGDGAGVLGSEPRLQSLRASAPCDDHSEQRDDDQNDDDDDQQTGVHGCSSREHGCATAAMAMLALDRSPTTAGARKQTTSRRVADLAQEVVQGPSVSGSPALPWTTPGAGG